MKWLLLTILATVVFANNCDKYQIKAKEAYERSYATSDGNAVTANAGRSIAGMLLYNACMKKDKVVKPIKVVCEHTNSDGIVLDTSTSNYGTGY